MTLFVLLLGTACVPLGGLPDPSYAVLGNSSWLGAGRSGESSDAASSHFPPHPAPMGSLKLRKTVPAKHLVQLSLIAFTSDS